MRSGSRVLWAAILLLLAFDAQAKTASEVFDTVSPSVVIVLTFKANGEAQGLGSGVVLPDGEIATNCHVVEDAATIQVVYQTVKYPAKLRFYDKDRDVCSLSVSGLKAPAVVMGSTSRIKVGARVYAIGAPRGLDLTLSEGIISSLRSVEDGQYLQITAPISPGSSGGGLFDEEGRLVGLPTFYLTEGQQLNFAVPVEWVSELPRRHAEASRPETPLTDWLNHAIALEEKEEWGALIDHSLRWTKAQPTVAVAWGYLGAGYGETGQTVKEIEAYKQALRINPENHIGWYLLGFAYSESGQIDKSIDAYQEALRNNPGYGDALYKLCDVYLKKDQTASAIDELQGALNINPGDAKAWGMLGLAYSKSGQTTKATKALQQALRIQPENAETWFNLGIVYRISGQTEQVMEVYKRLKNIDPTIAVEFFDKIVLP